MLSQAIKAGVLRLGPDGKIAAEELARFLESLGTCRLPLCEEPARYPSLCCSKGHAVSMGKASTEWRQCERLLSRPDLENPDCKVWFRPRPDQLENEQGECCSRKCAQLLRRAREEEAGALKGERVTCKCGCGQSRLVFPSQRATLLFDTGRAAPYQFLNLSHWAQYRWQQGIALKPTLQGLYRSGHCKLETLKSWFGKWSGKKGGGRPTVKEKLGAAEVAAIQELKAKHPEMGYGAIATYRSALRGDDLVTLDRVRTILKAA
jgi:hypothetical protein